MNNQEYEQKKHEYWKEYVNLLNHNPAARYVFDKIFDRAYALGKQEKDADTVIQGWVAIEEAYNQAFIHTEKPIQKTESFTDMDDPYTTWESNGENYIIETCLFPDLTWSDDPQEVEIIIKRKKK